MQQNRQSQGTRGPVEASRSGPKPRASKTQQAPSQVTQPRPRRQAAAAAAGAGGPAGASDEGGLGVGAETGRSRPKPGASGFWGADCRAPDTPDRSPG